MMFSQQILKKHWLLRKTKRRPEGAVVFMNDLIVARSPAWLPASLKSKTY